MSMRLRVAILRELEGQDQWGRSRTKEDTELAEVTGTTVPEIQWQLEILGHHELVELVERGDGHLARITSGGRHYLAKLEIQTASLR